MSERTLPPEIGPYRLVRELGRGGFGSVHVALDGRTGQEVALKLLGRPSEHHLQSIRREIRALSDIGKRGLPGIVRILDDGIEDGAPWYAMELVKGETLRQRMGCVGHSSAPWPSSQNDVPTAPLGGAAAVPPAAAMQPVPDALNLATRICRPLALLHGEGMVHRDLKPENIILRADGSACLVDFGLTARFTSDSSRESLEVAGDVMGTVSYMAPEQCRGLMVDARADLYALGCILYELLTGAPPFVADLSGRVLMMHLSEEPLPPSARVASIPAKLDRLILRLLAKEPRDRIGHAEDVARALHALGAEAWPATAPRPRPYLYQPAFVERPLAWKRLLWRSPAPKPDGQDTGLSVTG